MQCGPSAAGGGGGGCGECSVLCNATWFESYNYSSYGYTYDEQGEIVGQSGPQHVEPVCVFHQGGVDSVASEWEWCCLPASLMMKN